MQPSSSSRSLLSLSMRSLRFMRHASDSCRQSDSFLGGLFAFCRGGVWVPSCWCGVVFAVGCFWCWVSRCWVSRSVGWCVWVLSLCLWVGGVVCSPGVGLSWGVCLLFGVVGRGVVGGWGAFWGGVCCRLFLGVGWFWGSSGGSSACAGVVAVGCGGGVSLGCGCGGLRLVLGVQPGLLAQLAPRSAPLGGLDVPGPFCSGPSVGVSAALSGRLVSPFAPDRFIRTGIRVRHSSDTRWVYRHHLTPTVPPRFPPEGCRLAGPP